jgi:hypothetical protein
LIFGVEFDGEGDADVSNVEYGAASGEGAAGIELPEELRLCNFPPRGSFRVDVPEGIVVVEVYELMSVP